MQTLAPDIANYIIIHAVRSKEFLKAVASKIQIGDFDGRLEYPQALCWSMILDYWKKYSECVPLPLLKLSLTQAIVDETGLSEEDINGIWILYDSIVNYPEAGIQVNFMIDRAQRFLQVRRTSTKVAALQHGDIPSVLKEIQQLTREINLSSVQPEDLSALSFNDIFDGTPRIPTGVLLIDELLSGGVKNGEIYGFIGPVGGGKSTTAHTLIAQGARRQRHVALFSYEEGGESIPRRIYINNAGVNRTFAEDRPLADIPTEVVNKLSKSKAEIDPYFQYLDMTTQDRGRGGVDEFASVLQDLCDRGKKPELVCVDWVGEMAAKWLQGQGKDAEGGMLRSAIGRITSGMLEVSQRLQIPIFLFHQLNKEKCQKPAIHAPSWTDSQDARNFADLLQYCFVLGTSQEIQLDDRNVSIAWLVLSKARGMSKKRAVIEIDGAYCRIRKPKTNWVPNRYSNSFEPSAGSKVNLGGLV